MEEQQKVQLSESVTETLLRKILKESEPVLQNQMQHKSVVQVSMTFGLSTINPSIGFGHSEFGDVCDNVSNEFDMFL